MWKVVAADDEGYIREALQKLINWEKMDCSVERNYWRRSGEKCRTL